MITNERLIVYNADGTIKNQPIANKLFATANANDLIRVLIPISDQRYALASFTPSLNIQNPDLLAMDNKGLVNYDGALYTEFQFLLTSTILDYYDKTIGESLGFAPRLYYVEDNNFLGVVLGFDSGTIIQDLVETFPDAKTGDYVRVYGTDTDWQYDGTTWVDTNDKTAVFVQDKPFETYNFPVEFANSSGKPKVKPTSEEMLIYSLNQKANKIDLQNTQSEVDSLENDKLNRDGQQPMIGNLNMGGFRINNNPDLTELTAKDVDLQNQINAIDNLNLDVRVPILEGKATTLESTSANHEGRITVNETGIAELQTNQINLQNNKVDKTLTIMDLDLQNNITRTEVVNALGEATQILSGLMSTTDKARLDALHALLGTQPDADSIANTINEVLAVFDRYPEGANLLDTLNGKVDKVSGKQLSTNDLTDVLKNHYDVAYTHSQQTDNNPHATKFDDLLGKPNTIAGFGITDAFTKAEVNSLIEGLKISHNLEQTDLTPTPLVNNGTLPILTVDAYDMIVVMVTVDGQNDSKVFVPNNIQENETFKAVIQTTPTVNMTITKGALNYTFSVDGGTSIEFKVDGWKVTELVASDVKYQNQTVDKALKGVGNSVIDYHSNGKVKEIVDDNVTTTPMYDVNGNLTKITEVYSLDGKTYETTFIRDARGRIINTNKQEVI